jgi:hypothetical protein
MSFHSNRYRRSRSGRKEFVIRNVKLNESYNLDNASLILIVKGRYILMVKLPRRGYEKLFQRLFSLPAFIIVTLVIVIILIPPQQIPTSSISS